MTRRSSFRNINLQPEKVVAESEINKKFREIIDETVEINDRATDELQKYDIFCRLAA